MLGPLIAAGHSVDEILDWTWPQIAIAARSVARHHYSMFDMIMQGAAAAMGFEWKTSKVKATKATNLTKEQLDAQKDAHLLLSLNSSGITIK